MFGKTLLFFLGKLTLAVAFLGTSCSRYCAGWSKLGGPGFYTVLSNHGLGPLYQINQLISGSNVDCEYSKIRQGEIYVQENFLTPQQVQLLRQDIAQLQRYSTTSSKGFRPSGLSNRVKGDKNKFGSSDRLTCTITSELYASNKTLLEARSLVEDKLETLRRTLQEELSWPLETHHRTLELAELYYSVSPKGSHLPRHQDERHEETKGSKGWINDTRRSISWLIYLNEDGWGKSTTSTTQKSSGQGGELRAYVRKCCSNQGVQCGSHDGNIQVGWLRQDEASPSTTSLSSSPSAEQNRIEYEPVFLNSWVKIRADIPGNDQDNDDENNSEDALEWQALSALYRIRTDDDKSSRQTNHRKQSICHETEHPMRDYLSPPFGPNSPSWPSNPNLEPTDFASALKLQLSDPDHQKRFVGVEDITKSCEIVDVVPTGGTLILFDSVAVPHQVLEVAEGTRLAIAGWFHEAQQDFPEWYGT